MVKVLANLGEHQDRVAMILQGKYGLKNKSDAINLALEKIGEELEPQLRPEYETKLTKIVKGRHMSRKQFERLIG